MNETSSNDMRLLLMLRSEAGEQMARTVLSTLVAKQLDWQRVPLLLPDYNYPLNLLGEMPPDLRPSALDGLVNAVYEEAFPWSEIEIHEPLRSWLRERLPG